MTAKSEATKPHWRQGNFWALVALQLLLFFGSYRLFVVENDFLFLYHPDEPKKAFALTKDRLQFNHPLLMIQSSKVLYSKLDEKKQKNPQEAARCGRKVSAFYLSGAVAGLVLIAFWMGGWPGWWISAALLLSHPMLFEYAHYMKEDATFTFGLVAFCVGAGLFLRHPRAATAVLMGVGAGLASSSKYVGVMCVIMALVIPFLLNWKGENKLAVRRRFVFCGLAIGAALLIFAVVNYPMIQDMAKFSKDLDGELKTFETKSHILYFETPHLLVFEGLKKKLGILLSSLAIGGLLYGLIRDARVRKAVLPLVMVAVSLAVIYCFSLYFWDRYLLPMVAFSLALAGGVLGAAILEGWKWRRPAGGVAGALAIAVLLLVVPPQLAGLRYNIECFRNDTRTAMYEFVKNEMEESAVIAQGKFSFLPYDQKRRRGHKRDPIPHTVISRPQIEDFESIEELRRLGVTHVATGIVRGLDSSKKGSSSHGANVEWGNKRERFYRDLLANSHPIWESTGPYGCTVATPVEIRRLQPTASTKNNGE